MSSFSRLILAPGKQVSSTDPSAACMIPSLSAVPKYEMPVETYSTLPDTVLAYKRANRIGRFDPGAPSLQEQKIAEMWGEIEKNSKPPLGMSISAIIDLVTPFQSSYPMQVSIYLPILLPCM